MDNSDFFSLYPGFNLSQNANLTQQEITPEMKKVLGDLLKERERIQKEKVVCFKVLNTHVYKETIRKLNL